MKETPTWATTLSIIGLIGSIAAFIIPIAGVTMIAPASALLTAIGIYGGARNLGIAVIIITAINYIISPAWWSLWAGETLSGNSEYFFAGILSVIAFALMPIAFFFQKK